MKTIEELLIEIKEDKKDNLSTTSFEFKRGIWEFFNKPEFQSLNACEFGTHKGQTTRILSFLFNEVHTINISENHFKEARHLNQDRSNIIYVPFNLYGEKVELKPTQSEIGVFFIDAGHDYNHVDSDIRRMMKMNHSPGDVFVIFDDYGAHKGVYDAVNDWVFDDRMKIVHFIGHQKGHDFGQGRVLKASEGVICKIIK